MPFWILKRPSLRTSSLLWKGRGKAFLGEVIGHQLAWKALQGICVSSPLSSYKLGLYFEILLLTKPHLTASATQWPPGWSVWFLLQKASLTNDLSMASGHTRLYPLSLRNLLVSSARKPLCLSSQAQEPLAGHLRKSPDTIVPRNVFFFQSPITTPAL